MNETPGVNHVKFTPVRQAIFAWALCLSWMAFIYALSHQPNSGRVTEHYFGLLNIPVRKLAHLLEFAVLFNLYRRACALTLKTSARAFSSRSEASASVLGLLLTISYAAADEWHQSFVPGRSATLSDALVDAAGGLLGLIGYALWAFRKGRT